MSLNETVDAGAEDSHRGGVAAPVPGLLLVWSCGRPQLHPLPLGERPVVLGRGAEPLDIDDARMSRSHAEVSFDGAAFVVRDLGSRNGTAVDGTRLGGAPLRVGAPRVLRTGDTVFVFASDLRPYRGRVEVRDGIVVGPALARSWSEIADVARTSDVLHLTGPSGAGKELAARHFHRSGPLADGPFIAVNCATIPGALAERLLFGARKGAYSGADADSEGSLQGAHGGTLFLDEIAELEPGVQAKVLRVLETREVVPLGATRGRRVDLRLVSATHGDLRKQVAAGRFREDLFFRLGRPAVSLPSLRERASDLPWIAREALRDRGGPAPDASLVESALLRAWPGNVRELVVEVREAARRARAEGSATVEAKHLDAQAGMAVSETSQPTRSSSAPRAEAPDRETLVSALERAGGNISQAARELGVHRTQLRRWMIRHGLAEPPEVD